MIVTRSRYFNDPNKILEDNDDKVTLRTSAISMLMKSRVISLEKVKIAKIQRAKNTISIFTHDNNVFDIWVVGKFTELTWQRAQLLFPEAKVVVIEHAHGSISNKRS
ncbi:hypothetical protein [Thalassotalea atypica]|uniref:hypothetical protein n=1 Tax=Thalassotalea atypica TaxID=2054316 RepID=UPI002572C247|nr:hypothetical protein [Thalassotalea atypica]